MSKVISNNDISRRKNTNRCKCISIKHIGKEHNHMNKQMVIKKFKYNIECVQNDNGIEFTNRLNVQNGNKKTMN